MASASFSHRRLDLRETASADYAVRTEANVVNSDATVVLCRGTPAGGSLKTVGFADKHRRPCLAVDVNIGRKAATDAIASWLEAVDMKAGVLNVAASRECKSPGIRHLATAIMVDVISRVNVKMFYPLSGSGEG